jgi:transglutaminase-like putative cysteine protease
MTLQTPEQKYRHSSQSQKENVFTQLSKQLRASPNYVTEESILLRILVQCLVTVGIVATDVAASNVAELPLISLWAVPTSAIGATWSWFRRRSRNIPTKFGIAIAMLLALVMFFDNLLRQQQDTRLSLAYLLIQLQVFHSFDLPRRKDLGYSMMIGLILVGVAATLSQTLMFAPFLIAFLAIALPTLVLDYRSKLGLAPSSLQKSVMTLPLRRIGIVMGVTIVLGLAIFAVMPRFQGYQIRSFPVSTPIEFDGEFNASIINNPGYENGQNSNETGFGTNGNGSATEEGASAGEVDDESYYGFSSRMNQNLRGELVPKVLMRVRSQAEGFWRVLAFDRYTGQGWEISRNEEDDVEIIDRPPWTYGFRLPWGIGANRTREVIQTFTIVEEMPNLIPALYEPRRVYFPTEQIAIDPEGSLRSPINLIDGITYTVLSAVPYRDRTQLRETNTTYSDEIRTHYLQLPEAQSAMLRQTTEEILQQSDQTLTQPYEIALYLAQYLKQQYTIQPDLPFLAPDEDLAEAFLNRYNGGYPDHFSTVLTVMLRSIGIPSRLVAGFAPGEFNPFTGFYIVKNVDAYAMTEVFFPNYGWFPFDPIPGHEVIPPTIEDYETFGVLKQFWNWVAGWLPSPVRGLFAGVMTAIGRAVSWAIATVIAIFTNGWTGVLLGIISLIGLGFVGWLLWVSGRSLIHQIWLRKLPPMEALYQQMLDDFSAQGLNKSSAETALEYVRGLKPHQPSERSAAAEAIAIAYVQWRYGNIQPKVADLQQQWKLARTQRFSFSRSLGR